MEIALQTTLTKGVDLFLLRGDVNAKVRQWPSIRMESVQLHITPVLHVEEDLVPAAEEHLIQT